MDWNSKIKEWYNLGTWTAAMVESAVTKNKISQEQCGEILANIG